MEVFPLQAKKVILIEPEHVTSAHSKVSQLQSQFTFRNKIHRQRMVVGKNPSILSQAVKTEKLPLLFAGNKFEEHVQSLPFQPDKTKCVRSLSSSRYMVTLKEYKESCTRRSSLMSLPPLEDVEINSVRVQLPFTKKSRNLKEVGRTRRKGSSASAPMQERPLSPQKRSSSSLQLQNSACKKKRTEKSHHLMIATKHSCLRNALSLPERNKNSHLKQKASCNQGSSKIPSARKRYLMLGHKDAVPYSHDKCPTNPPNSPKNDTFDILLYPSMRSVSCQLYVVRKIRALVKERVHDKEQKLAEEKRAESIAQQKQNSIVKQNRLMDQRKRIYALNALMSCIEEEAFKKSFLPSECIDLTQDYHRSFHV